ncbi:YegP family protein [Rhizobium sp. YTU87027]|uniref:YegP family protein n=1 Tax=Rhizobium sp. YTU87027 TaxID=3417741 RepID=UPI003D68238E
MIASCVASNGDRWEIYSGSDGCRWRRTAANGSIVGASSQGYSSRSDCIDNARRNGMSCNPT